MIKKAITNTTTTAKIPTIKYEVFNASSFSMFWVIFLDFVLNLYKIHLNTFILKTILTEKVFAFRRLF